MNDESSGEGFGDRLDPDALTLLRDYRPELTIDTSRIRLRLTAYIAGVEITQGIQYHRAASHLTDPADRGPNNSVGIAARKAAWVRVYVRSGFISASTVLTGKLVVERQTSLLPMLWSTVGELTPRAPGSVNASSIADYATERGNIASSLNFVLPSDWMTGKLRIRAVIWPTSGSAASPSDTQEISVNASLEQTLRVRGILIRYNGPNAAGTGTLNLAAPTVANLQATCGITHTVFPVQATGVYSSGGTITWGTPLTGMATNPGGCSQQWLDLNVAIAQARTNDGNRTDVIYVGLLPVGIPIANVGGCASSGVTSVPNGQQWTMAHEIGHAAGLAHGPCGTPGDANYPAYEPYDPAGTPTSSLGEYGLDINNGIIHPPQEKDFMSYCGPTWISLYHHGRLFDNARFDPRRVGLPKFPQIPELVDPWLWPWEYIPDPPLWDRPPFWTRLEVQPLISIIGKVELSGEVKVLSVMRVKALADLKDVAPTSLRAELIGAGGNVVAEAPVMRSIGHGCGKSNGGCGCGGNSADDACPKGGYAFQVLLSDVEPGETLRIVRPAKADTRHDETVWLVKSSGKPVRISAVQVDVKGHEISLRWEASTGQSPVDYSIQYSKDKGRSWNGLAVALREPTYRCSTLDLPSGRIIFRVLAHDGFQTGTGDSKPVDLRPRPPSVAILHPQPGRSFEGGSTLRLIASVNTHVGAENPKLKVTWEIDGKRVADTLEAFIDAPKRGRHTCRVVAKDDGGSAEDAVTFVINADGEHDGELA